MKIALAVLAALAFFAETGRARGQDGTANSGSAPANQPATPTLPAQEPAPAPTLPPATNPSLPAYTPPVYGYPPAYYPYPPGYAYPPGYPQYPPAYPSYQPPTVVEPPFEPVAMGRWRIGAAGIFFGQGILSYKLNLPGGDTLAYSSGNAAATLGFAPFAQFQATQYLFLGFSMQYIPKVQWAPISSTAANGLPSGSGSELDFLPQLGVTIPVARRLHLVTFGTIGYSLLFASDLVTDAGTARGLLLQTGVGLLYAMGSLGFLELRGSYQWGYQNSQFQSPNNGETAVIEMHSQYFGLQAGGGFWF